MRLFPIARTHSTHTETPSRQYGDILDDSCRILDDLDDTPDYMHADVSGIAPSHPQLLAEAVVTFRNAWSSFGYKSQLTILPFD